MEVNGLLFIAVHQKKNVCIKYAGIDRVMVMDSNKLVVTTKSSSSSSFICPKFNSKNELL